MREGSAEFASSVRVQLAPTDYAGNPDRVRHGCATGGLEPERTIPVQATMLQIPEVFWQVRFASFESRRSRRITRRCNPTPVNQHISRHQRETTSDRPQRQKSRARTCHRSPSSNQVLQSPTEASMPWHTEWHTKTDQKQKSPSESITWAHVLAERAGFEPAVGINLHTLSRRAT